MNMKLPSTDSATGRGVRTGLFASAGALILFGTGLITVLNNVPGCSEAVLDYLQSHALEISLAIGVPSGLLSFVFNFFRPGVRNY